MSVTIDCGVKFNDGTEMKGSPRTAIQYPSVTHPSPIAGYSREVLAARSNTVPVGSYAFLRSEFENPTLTALLPIGPGTEVDGISAQLHPSDRSGAREPYAPERYMDGTWRCMGYISTRTDRRCIWLKVAL